MMELVALAPLGAASVYDIRYRQVPDWLWLAFLPAAAAVAVFEAWGHAPVELVLWGLVVVLLSVAGFAAWLMGVQGGADAKAIALLAVMASWPLRAHQLPLAADALLAALVLVLVARTLGLARGKVPFLPYLTVGFLAAWLLGDPLPQLLRAVHQ